MQVSTIGMMPFVFILAGCGGGGDGEPPVTVPTFATATGNITLSAAILDAGAGTATNSNGTLNGTSNAADFAGITGTISTDRTLVTLADGGQIALESAGDGFATRFRSAPQSGPSTTGIVGLSATDLPTTGSATMTGNTQITATVGAENYELIGMASVVANFGESGKVTTTLSRLSGTRLPPLAAATAVKDVGTLTLTGSIVDGTEFAGGTAASTGTVLSLSGGQTTDVAGQFFGPGGAEVGGTFVITDTNTIIRGDFLAD